MQSEPLLPPAQAAGTPPGNGFLNELGWLSAAFVLPAASLSFYRRVQRRSTGSAILFFMLFMLAITLVATVGIVLQLSQVSTVIRGAFDSGRVPEITIRGGVATVKGPQPAILIDSNGTFVAIDTTGKLREIDRERYSNAFLLTATDLKILSSTQGAQSLPLSELQKVFNQDPLVINAESMARLWQGLTLVLAVVVFFGLLIWNLLVRLLYLALLALLVQLVLSLFNRKIPYGLILSVGIYAFVPVIYLMYIIGRLTTAFFLLQTLLLLIAWGVGLAAALAPSGRDFIGPDRPLRAWRALVGVPWLLVLGVDRLFTLRNGGWFDFFAGLLTAITLAIAGWYSLPPVQPELPNFAEPPTAPSL